MYMEGISNIPLRLPHTVCVAIAPPPQTNSNENWGVWHGDSSTTGAVHSIVLIAGACTTVWWYNCIYYRNGCSLQCCAEHPQYSFIRLQLNSVFGPVIIHLERPRVHTHYSTFAGPLWICLLLCVSFGVCVPVQSKGSTKNVYLTQCHRFDCIRRWCRGGAHHATVSIRTLNMWHLMEWPEIDQKCREPHQTFGGVRDGTEGEVRKCAAKCKI